MAPELASGVFIAKPPGKPDICVCVCVCVCVYFFRFFSLMLLLLLSCFSHV